MTSATSICAEVYLHISEYHKKPSTIISTILRADLSRIIRAGDTDLLKQLETDTRTPEFIKGDIQKFFEHRKER